VAEKIRRDDRVSVIERTNLRYLSELPQKVDLVTLDLSFISILLVSFQTVVNIYSVAIFKDVLTGCFHPLLYLFAWAESEVVVRYDSSHFPFLDLSKFED
jgi:hypothetical protein